jgi:hypothetical protein
VRRPRSIATAVASIIAAKHTMRTWPETPRAKRPPTSAPTIPAAAKPSPVRTSTRPARAWVKAPAALVSATTRSEAAIAALAGHPAT